MKSTRREFLAAAAAAPVISPILLGVQDKVGSIEVGKDADVAIWSGHPLSVYSSCETTFIDGEMFFDKKKDLTKRDQMAKDRADLERAEQTRPVTRIVP